MNTTNFCPDRWPMQRLWFKLCNSPAVRVAHTILDEVSRFSERPTPPIDPHLLPGRPQAIEMFAFPMPFIGKPDQRPLADSLEALTALETVHKPAKLKPPKPKLPFHYLLRQGKMPKGGRGERHVVPVRL